MTAFDWNGQRVSVLGLARSGLALARVLGERGARVLLSDQRSAEQLGEAVAQALALGAEVETGGHSDRVLDCDTLVISPGVSLYAPLVQRAFARGVAVVGEVEVAYRLCSRPIVAVTGTNGKSTTCSLLQAALGERGRLAGNIGTPLVAEVSGDLSGVDYVVAEISSFQLETVQSFRPRVGLLTNVTPDHLDRHHSLEEYFEAKARLFAYQQPGDLAIFNADDPEARRMAERVCTGQWEDWGHYPPPVAGPRQILLYSTRTEVECGAWLQDGWFWLRRPGAPAERLLRWDYPNLPGPHNLSNALAAALVAVLLDTPADQIAAAFAGYQRMHHRLEGVGELDGVRFIDDSKATNVSSVESALLTYAEPVVLIAGGRDKGLDLDRLGQVIARHCHGLVAIGEAGPRIREFAELHGLKNTQIAASMDEAVRLAHQAVPSPGVVLLSPACTSFDMFRNAEHRGEEFAASARRWIEKAVVPLSTQQSTREER